MAEIQLHAISLLETLAKVPFFPTDEVTVRLCMNPLYIPQWGWERREYPDGSVDAGDREDLDDRAPRVPDEQGHYSHAEIDTERSAILVAMLRTGAVFCLGDDALAAVDSALQGHTPELPELPPLPFPRVLIEARHEDAPAALVRWYPGPDEMVLDELQLLALNEHTRGELWHVSLVVKRVPHPDADLRWVDTDDLDYEIPRAYHFRLRATSDGVMVEEYDCDIGMSDLLAEEITNAYDPQPRTENVDTGIVARNPDDEEADTQDDANRVLVGLAITVGHLLSMRGTRTTEKTFDRGQRRRLDRKYQAYPAHVYFVDLSATGERKQGESDREYHVRWLVRGHWRLSASGDTLVRAKGGMCVWVKPHVKGPPTAPWKGRPVHTSS